MVIIKEKLSLIFTGTKRNISKNFKLFLSLTVLLLFYFALLKIFSVRVKHEHYATPESLFLLFLVFSGIGLFLYLISLVAEAVKKSLKNILLLMVVLWIGFSCTELLLRKVVKKWQTYQEKNAMDYVSCYQVWNKSWFFVHNSHFFVRTIYPEYTFESQTNSEGISDREFSRAPGSNVFRIITLGDSFTEGFGAPRDSSWPRLLEKKLQGAYAPDSIEVMNAGIGGSDVYYEYMLLKYRLLKYRPSLVIVALNSSDIHDLLVRGGMERFNKDSTVSYKEAPGWEWIYASSYIFRHIAHDLFGYDFTLIRKNQLMMLESKAAGEIKDCLRLFQDLAVQENFRLLVVLHPDESDIVKQKNLFGKEMEKACRQSGISCTNLYNYFIGSLHMNNENHYLYFWKIDSHHNSRGYQAMADGVFAWLNDNSFIIWGNQEKDGK